MYWTCIHREPIQLGDLLDNIVPTISKANLLETLESLSWRSLIEKGRDANTKATFTQQPVVMEYMTNRLVAGVCKIKLLNKYVLIGERREVVRSPRPYENMNITGITSLNPQKATLKTLGALELVSNYQSTSKVLDFPKLARSRFLN